MDLLTKRLFIEGHPRVERGDDLAGGHIVLYCMGITHCGGECDVHGDHEDLEETVMLMLFRELALAEVEVFRVMDHIKAEESSGNLYK